MSFLNNIGSKISNVGNQVSSKVKDSGEQLKLSNEINGLKGQVTQHYQKLGELYYAEHRGGSGVQNYDAECDVIDQLKALIAEKEAKIIDIKTQVTCPVCGKSIAADSIFCPYCGAPIVHEPASDAAVEMKPAGRVCPNCGAPLQEGALFCTSCGARVADNSSDNVNQPASQ